MYELRTRALKCLLEGHDSSINCVRFSTDSKTLVSTAGGGIKIWDLSTGKEGKKLKGKDFMSRMYTDVLVKKKKLKEVSHERAVSARTRCRYWRAVARFAFWARSSHETTGSSTPPYSSRPSRSSLSLLTFTPLSRRPEPP